MNRVDQLVVIEGSTRWADRDGVLVELDDNTFRSLLDGPLPWIVDATEHERATPHERHLPDGVRVVVGEPVLAAVGAGHAWVFDDATSAWIALGVDHLRVLALLREIDDPRYLLARTGFDERHLTGLLDELRRVGLVSVLPRDTPESSTPSTESGGSTEHDGGATTSGASPVGTTNGSTAAPEQAQHRPFRLPRLRRRRATPERPSRTPVYSFWATDAGPHLGSAAVVAYARVYADGILNDVYDLRRVAPASEVLEEIASLDGPAILLCSNYIWSLEANLEVARAAQRLNPHVLVVHGGPSTPRYERESEQFLRSLDGAHVAVNGEGEVTFAELLIALHRGRPHPTAPLEVTSLQGVLGTRYTDPHTGEVVWNEDRPRHAALEDFPSPLVSGELDDVDPEILRTAPFAIETNRGCPYSCTFCDWGQATMSRIRKFPMERVIGDFEWLARHRCELWIMADANFGIMKRDLDIIDEVVATRRRTGFPHWMAVAPPKNATKRFIEVVDRLLSSGVSMKTALALQTRDQRTLEIIDRSNIGTTAYDEIAIELRKRGLPLTCDLMVGLPGATVETFKHDLQWCIDQEIRAFLFPTFVLPNAPMNDPSYREEHGIRTVDNLIVTTDSFDLDDRNWMERLAYAYVLFEALGLLRHVLRFLQWDHGLPAMETIEQILTVVEKDPGRYPLVAWQLRHSDLILMPSVGWQPFFDEVHQLIVEELGVPDRSDLRAVLQVNKFLLPYRERSFPDALHVEHDYESYFNEARASLLDEGTAPRPARPLLDHGPGTVTVTGDPDDVCSTGLRRLADEHQREGFVGDFWITVHLELASSVLSTLPLSPTFLQATRSLRPDGPDQLAARP